MAVEILWLTDRSCAEAMQAADELLDLRTGPADLRKLLVVDDTGRLTEHAAVFGRLLGARRVENLLCMAVGPRPGTTRLPLPDSLGGTQGPGVLWAGDQDGIDWRAAAGATVIGRKRGTPSGMDRLIELLHVEDVFDRVYETFVRRVPDRVASPGLRLAGADDEAATFKAALALAIARITMPGLGDDGPFRSLLPDQAAVSLAGDGRLAGYRAEVAAAVAAAEAAAVRLAGVSRLFRRADAGADEHVKAAGATLARLRELVVHLLRAANTTNELTGNQRDMLHAAGLQFPPAPPAGPPDGAEPALPPGYRVIADALDGGDTLPLIQRRLTATAKELKRHGSAAYLRQVEARCPEPLPARLIGTTRLPSSARRADPAAVRRELGLDAADQAAAALIALVMEVASREWSPALTAPDELHRARITLEGIRRALAKYAAAAPPVRAARLVRLSESLVPVLRDLVRHVLADEYGAPSAAGQDTMDAAQRRTAGHLTAWTELVQASGVSARPKFASSGTAEVAYAVESDVAAIREALLAEPRGQMWQLCGQGDVTALDVVTAPLTVTFAPRLSKDELAGAVPPDTVWTSTGSQAGLLRLVPLRREIVSGDIADPLAEDAAEPIPADASAPEPR